MKNIKSVKDLTDKNESLNIIYRDLKLDLTNLNDDNYSTGIYKDNPINSYTSIRDIEASKNEEAILNSVKNWFNTSTYSRLLNPDLHMDLRDYLFELCDEYTAYFIGLDITKSLPYYEPRIQIKKCNITVNRDEGSFYIELQLVIPSLDNKEINLRQLLDSTGFTTI